MCLISRFLHPIHVPWLPMLVNIAPLSLHYQLATDNHLHSIEVHPHWPVYLLSFHLHCSVLVSINIEPG